MRKYEYKNATVYITEPTEKHLKIIREATEAFLKRVTKEQVRKRKVNNNGHNDPSRNFR